MYLYIHLLEAGICFHVGVRVTCERNWSTSCGDQRSTSRVVLQESSTLGFLVFAF